jgi:hypothetical protein
MNKKNIIRFLLILLTALLINELAIAGSAGTNYTYETQNIVNMPTAGIIQKNSQLFSLNFAGKSSLMLSAEFAPFSNASLGISFGGTGILGNETIKFQKYPGIFAKYRLLNEKKYLPAIAIGFNSQGQGNYIEAIDGYHILSPGFYLAFSKAFKWEYGFYAMHLGTNYSLEPKSEDKSVNVYFGFEHTFSERASFNFEYDFNTPRNNGFFISKGMTNIGIRYSIEKNSTLELKLADIFGTRGEMIRLLKIEFVGFLF